MESTVTAGPVPEAWTAAPNDREKAGDENVAPFGEAPDGGVRAWLVTAGAASIFFCCLGIVNSFGIFEQYYLTHQLSDKSPEQVAWIGSLTSFLQLSFGAIGGPLFDRYGEWVSDPSYLP